MLRDLLTEWNEMEMVIENKSLRTKWVSLWNALRFTSHLVLATLLSFLTGRRRRMKGGDKGRGVPHSLRPFVTRTRGLVGPRSARSSSSLPSAPNGLPPDRSAGYGVSKESDSKERTDMNVMSRGWRAQARRLTETATDRESEARKEGYQSKILL